MSAVRRLIFVAVFLTIAWTSAPRLIEDARRANEMRGLTPDARRTKAIGPMYESIGKIIGDTPRGDALGVIAEPGPDLDAALFFAYYAYPRVTKIYPVFEQYRMDDKRPRRTVWIDLDRSPHARLMRYEEIRAELIGSDPIVPRLDAGSGSSREFVVPLVTSGDGVPPDVFTTEAAMENRGESAAQVVVTFFPSKRSATIELKPREKRTWTDFVWQTFGVMEVGWLEMRSDAPVAAQFWLVNRGRRDADPLRFARFFRSASLIVPASKGRMWVLNPHDRELPVRLNEGDHRLPPRSVIPLEWVGGANISSEDEWYAFVTWRDANGNTHYDWPGAQ